MATTLSPNMSLPVPSVGLEAGPAYATDINACLALLDSHNHSVGAGTQITPSGLNISSDLSFVANNATNLRSVRLTPQSAVLATASDLNCISVVGVDLYYNDGSGNKIRLTQSGGVAGTSGSISGLTSPASATYVSATPAFVFQSAASTPANLDGGSLVIRNITASSKGVTINAPNALAANYSLTLPASLPGSTKIAQIDTSGNISASLAVDGSTITNSANTLAVPTGGITGTQIASSVALAGTPTTAAGLAVGTTLTAGTGIRLSSNATIKSDSPSSGKFRVYYEYNTTPNALTPAGSVAETPPISVIRGFVNSAGSIQTGGGWTVAPYGTITANAYTITFNQAFADIPAIVVTPAPYTNNPGFYTIPNVIIGSTSVFTVYMYLPNTASFVSTNFSFIAMGALY